MTIAGSDFEDIFKEHMLDCVEECICKECGKELDFCIRDVNAFNNINVEVEKCDCED